MALSQLLSYVAVAVAVAASGAFAVEYLTSKMPNCRDRDQLSLWMNSAKQKEHLRTKN